MFRVKLLYFIGSILIAACVAENDNNNESVDIKRSAICLIQGIAQKNNVPATYTKLNYEPGNDTTHIGCKLNLGNEEYTGNSTAFQKAKEKVAREAYAKTKYIKPTLHNRTCILQTTKNDISLLEEYADAIGKFVKYDEKPHEKGKFEYEVSLDGKSASGVSENKKNEAKHLAATRLIEVIGRDSLINTLILKYNATGYHSMEPMKRLQKIIQVTDLLGDGVYSKLRESSEKKDGKTVKRIIMQVAARSIMAAGAGYTVEEAKTNAATNYLLHLGFAVDYPPKQLIQ